MNILRFSSLPIRNKLVVCFKASVESLLIDYHEPQCSRGFKRLSCNGTSVSLHNGKGSSVCDNRSSWAFLTLHFHKNQGNHRIPCFHVLMILTSTDPAFPVLWIIGLLQMVTSVVAVHEKVFYPTVHCSDSNSNSSHKPITKCINGDGVSSMKSSCKVSMYLVQPGCLVRYCSIIPKPKSITFCILDSN